IQQPLMYAELSGRSQNVLAALQPLHHHLPECRGVPSHSSLCHSHFLSLQSVPIASVSILGFTPNVLSGSHRSHVGLQRSAVSVRFQITATQILGLPKLSERRQCVPLTSCGQFYKQGTG